MDTIRNFLTSSVIAQLADQDSGPATIGMGITQLSRPAESFTMDLIFVHGLNGNPKHTWTYTPTNFMWPQAIANDFKDIRVMVYGYDAGVAPRRNHITLLDYGRELAYRLRDHRRGDEERRRPLFLVGHSLGGLVIKQALVYCSKDQSKSLDDILPSVTALAFYGTPHLGSAIPASTRLKVIRKVANAFGIDAPSHIVDDVLNMHAKDLRDLTDEFGKVERIDQIRIFSFFETHDVRHIGLVVDQTSAVLGHGLEERRAVQADHRGMVKLKGRQDPGYKDFIAVIERVQQLPLPSSRRSYEFGQPAHFDWQKQIHEAKPFVSRDEALEALLKESDRVTSLTLSEATSNAPLQNRILDRCNLRRFGTYRFDGIAHMVDEALGVSYKTGRNNAAYVQEAMSQWRHPYFLIFDNVDQIEEHIAQFIPQRGPGLILIIDRYKTIKDAEFIDYAITVDTMSEEEALVILRSRLGGRKAEIDDHVDDAKAVVRRLGYLPLAVVQAASYLSNSPGSDFLAEYLKLYEVTYAGLEQRRIGNSAHTLGVFATLDLCLGRLQENYSESEFAKRCRFLSVCAFLSPSQISYFVFEKHLLEKSKCKFCRQNLDWITLFEGPDGTFSIQRFAGFVSELEALSLLTVSESTPSGLLRVSFHPLVQDWARQRESEDIQMSCAAEASQLLNDTVSCTMDDSYEFSRLTVAKVYSPRLNNLNCDLHDWASESITELSLHLESLAKQWRRASFIRFLEYHSLEPSLSWKPLASLARWFGRLCHCEILFSSISDEILDTVTTINQKVFADDAFKGSFDEDLFNEFNLGLALDFAFWATIFDKKLGNSLSASQPDSSVLARKMKIPVESSPLTLSARVMNRTVAFEIWNQNSFPWPVGCFLTENDCDSLYKSIVYDKPGAATACEKYLVTLVYEWTIFLLREHLFSPGKMPESLVDDTIAYCLKEAASSNFSRHEKSYQELAIAISTLAMHMCLGRGDLGRAQQIVKPLSTMVEAQSETLSKEVNQLTLVYLKAEYARLRLDWHVARGHYQQLCGYFHLTSVTLEENLLNVLEVCIRSDFPKSLIQVQVSAALGGAGPLARKLGIWLEAFQLYSVEFRGEELDDCIAALASKLEFSADDMVSYRGQGEEIVRMFAMERCRLATRLLNSPNSSEDAKKEALRTVLRDSPVLCEHSAESFDINGKFIGATLVALQSNGESAKAEAIAHDIFSKASALGSCGELDVDTYLRIAEITSIWRDTENTFRKSPVTGDRDKARFLLTPTEIDFYSSWPKLDVSLCKETLRHYGLSGMLSSIYYIIFAFLGMYENFSAFQKSGQRHTASLNLASTITSVYYFHPRSWWNLWIRVSDLYLIISRDFSLIQHLLSPTNTRDSQEVCQERFELEPTERQLEGLFSVIQLAANAKSICARELQDFFPLVIFSATAPPIVEPPGAGDTAIQLYPRVRFIAPGLAPSSAAALDPWLSTVRSNIRILSMPWQLEFVFNEREETEHTLYWDAVLQWNSRHEQIARKTLLELARFVSRHHPESDHVRTLWTAKVAWMLPLHSTDSRSDCELAEMHFQAAMKQLDGHEEVRLELLIGLMISQCLAGHTSQAISTAKIIEGRRIQFAMSNMAFSGQKQDVELDQPTDGGTPALELFTLAKCIVASPMEIWDEKDDDYRKEAFLKAHPEITAKLGNFPVRKLCQQKTLLHLSDRSMDFKGFKESQRYISSIQLFRAKIMQSTARADAIDLFHRYIPKLEAEIADLGEDDTVEFRDILVDAKIRLQNLESAPRIEGDKANREGGKERESRGSSVEQNQTLPAEAEDYLSETLETGFSNDVFGIQNEDERDKEELELILASRETTKASEGSETDSSDDELETIRKLEDEFDFDSVTGEYLRA